MKYTIHIDQAKSIEWGLSLSEAAMFSFVYALPSWAEQIHVNGQTWYFGSRNKAIDEMPLITDKPDTVYRLYKTLQAKGLIEWQKFGDKDCLRLTAIGKTWNKVEKADENPSLGKKSEQPRKKIRVNTEKNPTYKNTIDNSTNNKIISITNVIDRESEKNEKIGEAAKEFETYGEPELISKKEKKKTPPSSASTPPRPANIEYQMLEAYAQFMEQKGIPVSRNEKGHVQFDKRAFKSCKDWAVWASGMPNATDTLNDWQQFLEAAWATGDKWLLANFEPNILYSKRTNIVAAIGSKQAKAKELMKSDGFIENLLGW